MLGSSARPPELLVGSGRFPRNPLHLSGAQHSTCKGLGCCRVDQEVQREHLCLLRTCWGDSSLFPCGKTKAQQASVTHPGVLGLVWGDCGYLYFLILGYPSLISTTVSCLLPGQGQATGDGSPVCYGARKELPDLSKGPTSGPSACLAGHQVRAGGYCSVERRTGALL